MHYGNLLQIVRSEKRKLEDQLDRVRKAEYHLALLNSGKVKGNGTGTGTRVRVLSAAARERIAAAQRARWAKYKKNHKKAA